jgi:hypothetical protein
MRVSRVTIALVVTMAGVLWPAWSARAQDATISVDRWLISTPFPVHDDDPLNVEYLSAPGESGILPERGVEAGAAEWRLVRESPGMVGLDAILGERTQPSVIYGHTYIRSPEDRTVWLWWQGQRCSHTRAWLNGRSLSPPDPGGGAAVRLGLGWNTLLLKSASRDCPHGFEARLSTVSPGTLQGIQVQASRPPGDVRTGPEPWVLARDDAGPVPSLAWGGRELTGALRIRLTSWARTPVDSVRLKVEAGGAEAQAVARWLTPGQIDSVLIRVPFAGLVRVTGGTAAVWLDMRWDEERVEQPLSLEAGLLLRALHAPVRLLGWTAPAVGSRHGGEDAGRAAQGGGEAMAVAGDSTAGPELPQAPGRLLVGRWQVPGSLSGFTLALDIAESPGTYRLNSRAVEAEADLIPLCSECPRNTWIAIQVTSSDAWSALPAVRVMDPGFPATGGAGGSPSAVEWIRLLDEDGNSGYRAAGLEIARKRDSLEPSDGTTE